MIAKIRGKVIKKNELSVVVDVNGIAYEVLVPPVIMKAIDHAQDSDGAVSLVTYHYYQMDTAKAIPVLVGFLNEIEREFFELFITVSGVGPKAACKALAISFAQIAEAIDRGDMTFLKTLPGIGEQRAREIIAKLQGKVGKFALIQDKDYAGIQEVKEDIKDEALNVLLQLQYKKAEAKEMIEKALTRNNRLASCEDILNEVYKGTVPKAR